MRRTVGIQSFDTDISTVASTTSNTKLLSKDATRHLASMYNDSTAALTLLMVGSMGDTAADAALTAGRKTVVVAAGGYFELPENYVGDVWGKWDAANGALEITEYR